MTYAAEVTSASMGASEFTPFSSATGEVPPLRAVAVRAPAKRPLLHFLRRSPQAVPADAALCALIDRKANDREIIIWAFALNALCWFGLLYSFGAF
jgi:hypothetical protein